MPSYKILEKLGYSIGPTIGKGSYSKVKLARSKMLSKEVAIKIVDRKKAAPEFVAHFLPREIAILKSISHEHIIDMYDLIETCKGKVYIVMERAETDLLQKIQELTRIPNDQAKTWFSQILSAVTYLHQMDIAHRDLKCENILLTTDHQIKVADFGFGCFTKGAPDLSRTYCGSAAYTAPEVVVYRPYDPKKSDVWSLGVVLYTMVNGRLPFDASNLHKLPKIQKEPLVHVDTVEESCREFISALLEIDPEKRLSAADVVNQRWLQQS